LAATKYWRQQNICVSNIIDVDKIIGVDKNIPLYKIIDVNKKLGVYKN
jgi:hypothetical protein